MVSYFILKLQLPIPSLGTVSTFTGIITVSSDEALAVPIDITVSAFAVSLLVLFSVASVLLVDASLVSFVSVVDTATLSVEFVAGFSVVIDAAVLLAADELSDLDVSLTIPNIAYPQTIIIDTINIVFFMTLSPHLMMIF